MVRKIYSPAMVSFGDIISLHRVVSLALRKPRSSYPVLYWGRLILSAKRHDSPPRSSRRTAAGAPFRRRRSYVERAAPVQAHFPRRQRCGLLQAHRRYCAAGADERKGDAVGLRRDARRMWTIRPRLPRGARARERRERNIHVRQEFPSAQVARKHERWSKSSLGAACASTSLASSFCWRGGASRCRVR